VEYGNFSKFVDEEPIFQSHTCNLPAGQTYQTEICSEAKYVEVRRNATTYIAKERFLSIPDLKTLIVRPK